MKQLSLKAISLLGATILLAGFQNCAPTRMESAGSSGPVAKSESSEGVVDDVRDESANDFNLQYKCSGKAIPSEIGLAAFALPNGLSADQVAVELAVGTRKSPASGDPAKAIIAAKFSNAGQVVAQMSAMIDLPVERVEWTPDLLFVTREQKPNYIKTYLQESTASFATSLIASVQGANILIQQLSCSQTL